MNLTWETLSVWVVSGMVQNFTWMMIAIFFAQFVQRTYDAWRYGKWQVIVMKNGAVVMERAISPRKVKEILTEPSDMSVFLKGVVSPYGWIHCDVLTDGRKYGLFLQQDANRRLVLDLDKNPSGSSGNAEERSHAPQPKPAAQPQKRKKKAGA